MGIPPDAEVCAERAGAVAADGADCVAAVAETAAAPFMRRVVSSRNARPWETEREPYQPEAGSAGRVRCRERRTEAGGRMADVFPFGNRGRKDAITQSESTMCCAR